MLMLIVNIKNFVFRLQTIWESHISHNIISEKIQHLIEDYHKFRIRIVHKYIYYTRQNHIKNSTSPGYSSIF